METGSGYRNVWPRMLLTYNTTYFSLFGQIKLPTSEKYRLFDTLVESILNYSSEIGVHEARDIKNVHTKFCRWILNVKTSSHLTGLYGELGRVPMIVNRKNNYG